MSGPTTNLVEQAMRGGPGLLPAALRPPLRAVSLLYGAVVRTRNAAYDAGCLRARRLPVPVVSVGNLTAGGTGKTPAVEAVARQLQALGRRPAVLARGYGAPTADGTADEAAAWSAEFPLYTGPDRIESAQRALARGADCLVLDDGFQHRRVARDLDILLVDGLDPFGGGRLLPAGFLREPVRGAQRADLVVVTRVDQAPEGARAAVEAALRRAGAAAPVLAARHAPLALAGDLSGPPATLRGTAAHVFCGLGNPEGFLRTVQALGVAVRGESRFPDHHAYGAADLKAVAERAARDGSRVLLTTTKDWVKVRDLPRGGLPLAAIEIRFELVEGAERFNERLARTLEGPSVPRRPVEAP